MIQMPVIIAGGKLEMLDIAYYQYSLDKGECILRMPAKLSVDEFALFEEWMALVVRGQKRLVVEVDSEPVTGDNNANTHSPKR